MTLPVLTQADVSAIAACVQACNDGDVHAPLVAKLRALYILCGRQGVVLPSVKARSSTVEAVAAGVERAERDQNVEEPKRRARRTKAIEKKEGTP